VNPVSETKGFLHDEQGNKSAGRLYLAWFMAVDVLYALLGMTLFALLVTGGVHAPDEKAFQFMLTLYGGIGAVLSGFSLALITWVAGPRIAQYLGPQVSKMASAVGNAFNRDYKPQEWAKGDADAGVM
jgi:hypothetical protein